MLKLSHLVTASQGEPMKYQQLENLECGWKWHYLVKRHLEGELITRYIEKSAAQHAVNELLLLEHNPKGVVNWINEHLNPDLDNRMKQTIRARRKQIGRASCRERVKISVVAGSLKKNK